MFPSDSVQWWAGVKKKKKEKRPTKRSVHIQGQDMHPELFLFISHLTVSKCTVLLTMETTFAICFLFCDCMFEWNKILFHFFFLQNSAKVTRRWGYQRWILFSADISIKLWLSNHQVMICQIIKLWFDSKLLHMIMVVVRANIYCSTIIVQCYLDKHIVSHSKTPGWLWIDYHFIHHVLQIKFYVKWQFSSLVKETTGPTCV